MKTKSKGSCLVFFLYLHLLLIKTHGNTFSYENENLHIDKPVKGELKRMVKLGITEPITKTN